MTNEQGSPDDAASVAPAAWEGSAAERHAKRMVAFLAVSVALMMSGYGMIMPVFARRLGELDAGVDILGLMSTAFALGQLLFAPVLGFAADRYGRRPVILLALGVLVAVDALFLLLHAANAYVAIQFLNGSLTAGLLPAAVGMIGDLAPKTRTAQWTGMMMSSYGAGFIFGPAIGGVLCDAIGSSAPFLVSGGLAFAAFVFALFMIPESLRSSEGAVFKRTRVSDLLAALPRPLRHLAALFLLDFFVVFTFSFIEPMMIFYIYDQLHFSTTQFGIIVGLYGITLGLGQALMGGLSDRHGRRPVIALGFLLNVALYVALVLTKNFGLMLAASAVSGLGMALLMPALSASYLDIATEEQRSQVIGAKESFSALGGVLGPLAVSFIGRGVGPTQVFTIAGALVLLSAVTALAALPRLRSAGGS